MTDLAVRHLTIDVAALDMPLQWMGGDAFRTQLFNAMSMLFPTGEQYFIDAVREALPLLADAELRETVRRFIGQESTHSRLHSVFNERLERQGLRNIVQPVIAWRIRMGERFDVRSKLAIAMAYEHFTATFSDAVLAHAGGRGDWLDGTSEPMRVLWTWHAAEECEHRAVVYDVYRALGGGYAARVAWFLYVSLLFALDSTIQTTANLYRTGRLFHPATWVQGLRHLFGRDGVAARTLPAWFAYLRPSFSPHDGGETETARRWLEQHAAWFRA